MADEFVDARRKDDHSVTQRVPVSALPYFPDWEPIPTEPEQDAAQGEDNSGGEGPETADAGAKSTRTASKTSSKTDTSKGRGE